MYIFTCEPHLEAMLTCIYDAWASGKGHKNIRLQLEPVEQLTLFDEYIHVAPDPEKAEKVIRSVKQKISPRFYRDMAFTALAYEEDALDNIYRCLLLGFKFGPAALQMVQYRDIMRNQLIRIRLGKEVNRFQEFLRFHQVGADLYVAHIEPKSRLAITLGPIFQDRMPSEYWVIIDDVHREAVIHPKDEPFYLRILTEEEQSRLSATEQMNDAYTDLWKAFFRSIAIEERKNESLQRNLYPLWSRKHAVEFM